MKQLFLILLCLGIFVSSCDEEVSTNNEQVETANDTTFVKAAMPEAMLNELIETLPSSMELTSIIKSTGAKFDLKNLNLSTNHVLYKTDYQRALNIGIYDADLCYVDLYDRVELSMNYINAIKSLTDQLNVGDFFNIDALNRMALINHDVDSVLYLSNKGLDDLNHHLEKNNRQNLSILIHLGNWLESVHIATEIVKDHRDDLLYEKIGEQKYEIDILLQIIQAYSKEDAFFSELNIDFLNIKNEFDKITIDYVYKEPITKEINGQLVIEDQSTETVNITDENVHTISAAIHKLRQKIIGATIK